MASTPARRKSPRPEHELFKGNVEPLPYRKVPPRKAMWVPEGLIELQGALVPTRKVTQAVEFLFVSQARIRRRGFATAEESRSPGRLASG